MRLPVRPPLGLAMLLLVGSCVSSDSSTGVGDIASPAGLFVQPAVVPSAADASALPINRIRAVTARWPDNVVLGDTIITVDPAAPEWDISLRVRLTESPVKGRVFLRLINEDGAGTRATQYSGVTDTLSITRGATTEPADIPLVRGPLANLSVTAVTITSGDTVVEGRTLDLTADVSTSGNAQPTVFWTSLDTTVVRVSGSTATGVVRGSALVVATAGAISDTTQLTVIEPPVASVDIAPDSVDLVVGQTTTLTATTLDDQQTVLTGRPVIWSSTNQAVATVDQAGVVTTLTVGVTTITATSEGVSGTARVNVVPVPVDSVLVSPDSTEIRVGATTIFSAATFDSTGATLTGRSVSWSSSNASVATIDPGTGVATGTGPGSTVITGTSQGISDDAILVVSLVPVDSVLVSPDSADVTEGSTVTYTVQLFDSTGAVATGRTVTWSTADAGVASVDQAGVVTGVTVGATTVTATSEGVSDDAIVTVSPSAPPNLNAWTNAGGGVWSNPANWSRGAVPVSTDSVVIELGGTYTVTLDQNAAVEHLMVGGGTGTQTFFMGGPTLTLGSRSLVRPGGAFVQAAGTLAGSDTLSVQGSMTWSAGAQSGPGVTEVVPGATLALSGAGTKVLGGRILDVYGTATWTDTGFIQSNAAGSTLNIRPGAVFDIQNAATFNLNGGNGTINNEGTVTKSAGAGTSTVAWAFNNADTLDIRTDTVDISGSFNHAAGAVARGGGRLVLSSGTAPTLAGDLAPGTSPGILELRRGSLIQGSASTLNVELGGIAPGTGYDRLSVLGTIGLQGALVVDTINGFVPSAGDRFAVMTVTSRTGTFANVTLPTITGVTLDTVWAEAGTIDTLFVVANGPHPLVFSSDRAGNGSVDIWTQSAGGASTSRLTSSTLDDIGARWSPDGSELVFSRFDGATQLIFRMDADGSNLTQLSVDQSIHREPDWSATGDTIVFTVNDGVQDEIWLMLKDGTGLTPVTDAPNSNEFDATVSPDGSRILYVTDIQVTSEDIWVADFPSGANATEVTTSAFDEGDPEWSPDGSQIVFVRNTNGEDDIWIMDANGGNQVQLTTQGVQNWLPVFSPDGSEIYWMSDRTGNFEVWVMNRDGTNQRQLTDEPGVDGAPDVRR